MYSKRFIIFKYNFDYLVLVLIFRGMHYIIPFSFDSFAAFPLIYIPIAYLAVDFLFIKKLEKLNLEKEEYLKYVIVGFSIINLLLAMPIIYDICIVLFLVLLKKRNISNNEETLKNILEYYEKQDKK